MTSRTFKSTAGGFNIGIHSADGGVQFRITNMRGNYQQFITPADVAAEQALAILEASGVDAKPHEAATVPYGTPAHLGMIASHLKAYAEAKSMNDAEAREQAELEAEALELFKTFMGVKGYENFTWSEVVSKDEWLAVARKAREMRAEK